jgi:hypothetical protein
MQGERPAQRDRDDMGEPVVTDRTDSGAATDALSDDSLLPPLPSFEWHDISFPNEPVAPPPAPLVDQPAPVSSPVADPGSPGRVAPEEAPAVAPLPKTQSKRTPEPEPRATVPEPRPAVVIDPASIALRETSPSRVLARPPSPAHSETARRAATSTENSAPGVPLPVIETPAAPANSVSIESPEPVHADPIGEETPKPELSDIVPVTVAEPVTREIDEQDDAGPVVAPQAEPAPPAEPEFEPPIEPVAEAPRRLPRMRQPSWTPSALRAGPIPAPTGSDGPVSPLGTSAFELALVDAVAAAVTPAALPTEDEAETSDETAADTPIEPDLEPVEVDDPIVRAIVEDTIAAPAAQTEYPALSKEPEGPDPADDDGLEPAAAAPPIAAATSGSTSLARYWDNPAPSVEPDVDLPAPLAPMRAPPVPGAAGRASILLPVVAGIIAVGALGVAAWVYGESQRNLAAVSAELAALRTTLESVDEPAVAGDADLAGIEDRLSILEGVWRDGAASGASTPDTASTGSIVDLGTPAAGANADADDCLPSGTRFLVGPGDSYPVCGTSGSIDVISVGERDVTFADGTAIVVGGNTLIPGTDNCTVAVLGANESGLAGFGEIRVNC